MITERGYKFVYLPPELDPRPFIKKIALWLCFYCTANVLLSGYGNPFKALIFEGPKNLFERSVTVWVWSH
jgi:hypothetical protein